MLCRHCHKKIPVFYAWLVSAEFCCEAHAEAFRETVLARMASAAVESETAEAAAPLAPSPETRPDPEPDAAGAPAPERTEEPPQEETPSRAVVLVEAPEIDAEELWRLADQVGGIEAAEPPAPPVPGETRALQASKRKQKPARGRGRSGGGRR